MSFLSIILIALGLSMDALTVSITYGISIKYTKLKDALWIGSVFGFFQALMPATGWIMGSKLSKYITGVDHWAALLLLGFIGGKMVYETIKEDENAGYRGEKEKDRKMELNMKTLFLLAVATSIDALAAGIGFAFLNVSIVKLMLIIGTVTFILCFMGVYIGKKFGELLRSYAQLFGGILLVGIGLRIFIQHINAFLFNLLK